MVFDILRLSLLKPESLFKIYGGRSLRGDARTLFCYWQKLIIFAVYNRVFKSLFPMLNRAIFKIWNCCAAYSFFFLMSILLLMVGCSHVDDGKVRGRKAVDALLDKSESIMDDDAAYADSLMKLIDPSFIKNKERRARYALLYTAAEYKNYQPATSDSLIMTAVRHYSISNNIDYRFLSFYYLGCIYMDLNRYTDAAVAYTQAEQLVDRIDNEYWKGLLYSQLGKIFNEACDFNRAEEYFTKSEICYDRADKELHKVYALFYIGENKKNMHDFEEADSILRIVERDVEKIGDSLLYFDCILNRFSCTLYMNELDSATNMLCNYSLLNENASNTFGYLELMALYYNKIKDYDKSESYLEKARQCNLTSTDSIYWYFISSLLAENKGQIEESLEYYRNYTAIEYDNLRFVLSQPILGIQKEQYKVLAENELLRYNHVRLTLILCSVIFMLIIVIVLVTYHYKKKHMKEQLFDSLALVEELTALNDKHKNTIKQLKNEVRTQFHERHDISNRLYSMYFDSENQEKVTKQQLKITINSLIKDYTAPDKVRNLDDFINETYDGIMDRLADEEMGLTDKELQLFRYSFAGLSSKSVSVLIKESPQNIYQIKSRLLKKVRRNSEDLWNVLNGIW